jgi:predicted  nucleic acid-binding Zn-ribbon protein
MDQTLQTLIGLQAIDSRINALEADAARLPKEIAAIHAAVEDAQKQVEQAKARLDTARKAQRAKEKDLEVVQAKRSKTEGRLYEVKTNKEYSAVLIEIEEIKQEKARMEEEVLVLMESQERLIGDIREAEARLKQREAEGRSREAAAREQLRGVETDLAAARSERKELAARLPGPILADYDRILRARGGVALVPVAKPNFCGACRMTITPQRLQELRAQTSVIPCESCGRYLYWPS